MPLDFTPRTTDIANIARCSRGGRQNRRTRAQPSRDGTRRKRSGDLSIPRLRQSGFDDSAQ